jgi:hypothetical protein
MVARVVMSVARYVRVSMWRVEVEKPARIYRTTAYTYINIYDW